MGGFWTNGWSRLLFDPFNLTGIHTKRTISTSEARINAVNYQQSTFGAVKSVVYGTNKICGNIIESVDFTAISNTKTQKSGKGGQTVSKNTTYSYKVRMGIGLCYGPIAGLGKIIKNKSVTTLAAENLSLFNGSSTQNSWGEMKTYHPDRALAYRNLAYVAGNIDLGSNASVSQYSFEVKGKYIYGNGIVDANPRDIIYDILTNSIYGAGFKSVYIGDLSNYSSFCIANGVFLSPAYTAQEETQQILTNLAQITNSSFIWSQSRLKLIPLGDEPVTGNGVSWTPNLTPIYDLTPDDFLGDDEPVKCLRSQQTDVYNSVKLEFLNRANNYNVEIVEAQDLANFELYGKRPADTMTIHSVCTPEIARKTAQLALDRLNAVRNTYQFTIPIRYILLDPMDIVTLTYPKLGLDREPVRILSIKEDGEGRLGIEAEELIMGTANPAKYEHQGADRISIDYNQKVGNVNPVIKFEPPFDLTHDQLQVWVGVSGKNEYFGGAEVWISDNGETYKRAGEIRTPCRQGELSAPLPIGNEIDTVNSLSVDLSMSSSELLSGTQQDADNLNTLCYVDGELLAYQTATLTDTSKYNLTYLNRGAYNTEIKQHNAGTQFARIDETAFLAIPFKQEDIGKRIYIKFCSINAFGGGYQDLSEVEPYFHTIEGAALREAPADVEGLTDYYSDGLSVITWTPNEDPRSLVYEVRKGTSWGQSQQLGRVSSNKFTANGNGTYFVKALVPEYNIYSENTAAIEISGARLVQNVIATFDEKAEGWTGDKTDGLYVNEVGLLSLSGNGLFSSITKLSELKRLATYGELLTSGTYTSGNIVDIGQAQSCYINVDFSFVGQNPFDLLSQIPVFSKIQSLLGDYGNHIAGSKIQVSIAGNNDVWGEWKDFVTGQYYGKKFRFRAVLSSSSNKIVCLMTKFNISVDVPDIVDAGSNILIPNEGLEINFGKKFHIIPCLQTTILNKQQGDDEIITNLTETGFNIQVINNGQPVIRSINYTAQGY